MVGVMGLTEILTAGPWEWWKITQYIMLYGIANEGECGTGFWC
jgi:hypothetical protein